MTCQSDPYRAAGRRRCSACRSESDAIAAAWLDDDLIIGTWPAQCDHQPEMTMVVTPSRLEPDQADADADGAAR